MERRKTPIRLARNVPYGQNGFRLLKRVARRNRVHGPSGARAPESQIGLLIPIRRILNRIIRVQSVRADPNIIQFQTFGF